MKHIMIPALAVVLLSAASANAQSANNPNDSTFPESNQLNPAPREPDRNFGSSSSTYRLPAGPHSPVPKTIKPEGHILAAPDKDEPLPAPQKPSANDE